MGAPDKPLSARAAGEKLDIGYNQISDMVKGKSPGEKTLIKFASAVGESPTEWLRYAGKHDFAKTLDGAEAPIEKSDPAGGPADRPRIGSGSQRKAAFAAQTNPRLDPGQPR